MSIERHDVHPWNESSTSWYIVIAFVDRFSYQTLLKDSILHSVRLSSYWKGGMDTHVGLSSFSSFSSLHKNHAVVMFLYIFIHPDNSAATVMDLNIPTRTVTGSGPMNGVFMCVNAREGRAGTLGWCRTCIQLHDGAGLGSQVCRFGKFQIGAAILSVVGHCELGATPTCAGGMFAPTLS